MRRKIQPPARCGAAGTKGVVPMQKSAPSRFWPNEPTGKFGQTNPTSLIRSNKEHSCHSGRGMPDPRIKVRGQACPADREPESCRPRPRASSTALWRSLACSSGRPSFHRRLDSRARRLPGSDSRGLRALGRNDTIPRSELAERTQPENLAERTQPGNLAERTQPGNLAERKPTSLIRCNTTPANDHSVSLRPKG
jgi:hypothetical protein